MYPSRIADPILLCARCCGGELLTLLCLAGLAQIAGAVAAQVDAHNYSSIMCCCVAKAPNIAVLMYSNDAKCVRPAICAAGGQLAFVNHPFLLLHQFHLRWLHCRWAHPEAAVGPQSNFVLHRGRSITLELLVTDTFQPAPPDMPPDFRQAIV